MTVPPAAVIFSRAESENACAVMFRLDAGQVAGAEHLDRCTLADRAGRDQLVHADRAAVREQLGEPAGVDDLVLDLERGS